MASRDTIVALASGSLPAGVAVVRLSGPQAFTCFDTLCAPRPAARQLVLRSMRRAGDVYPIDEGLVALFPAPNSFTGEDVAEFQVHGSPAVVKALIGACLETEGVRLATAGEYSRRAFENGRLDMIEVEGLGDLIAAETESQRAQAVMRMGGDLSKRLDTWRAGLIELMAEMEASLDFSDEADVGTLDTSLLAGRLQSLQDELRQALDGFRSGRIVREGFRIGLAGAPNVGKSSVLNRLARSDVAIVTAEAGTTRDLREVAVNLDGRLVIFVDSAGLRETESLAEAEGVRRARAMLEQVDLVLWLEAPDVTSDRAPDMGGRLVRVWNKADLGAPPPQADMVVSAVSGAGFAELLKELAARVDAATGPGHTITLSHLRDQAAVEACFEAVSEAKQHLSRPELAAESLRQAVTALERLIGRVDAEQVLDRLFAGFCIGK